MRGRIVPAALAGLVATLAPAVALASSGGEEGGGGGIGFTFIGTVINFLILAFLIYKPVKKMLASKILERHNKVKTTIDDATAEIAKGRERLGQYKGLLEALPAEIAALEKEAREELAKERASLEAALADSRRRIEELTKELIEQEFKAARASVSREIAETIAARAEELFREKVGPREHAAIIGSAVARLEAGR